MENAFTINSTRHTGVLDNACIENVFMIKYTNHTGVLNDAFMDNVYSLKTPVSSWNSGAAYYLLATVLVPPLSRLAVSILRSSMKNL